MPLGPETLMKLRSGLGSSLWGILLLVAGTVLFLLALPAFASSRGLAILAFVATVGGRLLDLGGHIGCLAAPPDMRGRRSLVVSIGLQLIALAASVTILLGPRLFELMDVPPAVKDLPRSAVLKATLTIATVGSVLAFMNFLEGLARGLDNPSRARVAATTRRLGLIASILFIGLGLAAPHMPANVEALTMVTNLILLSAGLVILVRYTTLLQVLRADLQRALTVADRPVSDLDQTTWAVPDAATVKKSVQPDLDFLLPADECEQPNP